MHENEMNSGLDWHLCKAIYTGELCDSLFDLKKSRNTKSYSILYALQFSKLERFVDELVSNDDTPFVLYLGNSGSKEYATTSLASKYFGLLPDFIDIVNMLSPRYYYSERVNAFTKCCHSMGLLSEPIKWSKNIYVNPKIIYPRLNGASAAEIFNTLVKNIRSEWKINKFQSKVNARERDARQRHNEYCQYVDSLFEDCARLVVLRVDFFYKKQHSNDINVSDITKDLNHLLENKRCNSIFQSMKGHIAKLEHGIEKGVHWHVIFFFDGSKRNGYSHIHLAEKIGDYWVKVITKGLGDYWNVNHKANHYSNLGRRGIGVINWNDTDLRRNLNYYVVGYLCKVSQFIRPKFGPKVRLLRRGNFPKIPDKKSGRPRNI